MSAGGAHEQGAEVELVVCAARTWLDAVTYKRALTIVARGPDWDSLLGLAERHQVAPLVARTIVTQLRDACPAERVRNFEEVARASALAGLALAHDLIQIVQRFAAASIPIVAYKGPVLAQRLYGNCGLRTSADLDLFVNERDYSTRAAQLLEDDGFVLREDYGFERAYRSEKGVEVDLHCELTPPWIPLGLDFDTAFRGAAVERLFGTPIVTFDDVTMYIVLSVQLAKDVGERDGSPRLARVCDVAQALHTMRPQEWHRVVNLARQLGAVRIVGVASSLASGLFGVNLPPPLAGIVARDPHVGPLVRHAAERILGPESGSASDSELLGERAWHRAIRERARDRLLPYILAAKRAATPAEPDFAAVRLGPNMRFLYWAVRPVRIAGRGLARSIERLARRRS